MLAVDPVEIVVGFDFRTGVPIDTCEVMDEAGLVIEVTEEATIGANTYSATFDEDMGAEGQG